MSKNLLNAIINIKNRTSYDLIDESIPKNRMNGMGVALENFIKDAFCNSFEDSFEIKNQKYAACFSYLGNQNNPPDAIIKMGDAIEIKKIENKNLSDLALNSSYPKSKLFSDSPMITLECKNCEEWVSKDILYVVGNIKENKIATLIFIYGDCYAADKEIYERVKSIVVENIKSKLEYSDTTELGRINRVDPLGITNLRIRGMWTIQHPLKVYNDILKITNAKFQLFVLLKQEKYLSFPKEDRSKIEHEKDIILEDIKIPNPNNPAKSIECKLIKVIK